MIEDKSNFYYNRTDIDNISIDTVENAVDSLETALLFLVRNDNLKWKWVASSLMHSLYMFCIANLTGTNYANVLTTDNSKNDVGAFIKRGEDNWKKSKIVKRPKSDGYTIKWEDASEQDIISVTHPEKVDDIEKYFGIPPNSVLINFWTALARVQDDYGDMMMYIHSKPLKLSEDEWKSIEFLYYLVEKFLNFVPTSWGLEAAPIKKNCLNIIRVIKFLALDTFNVLYMDKNIRDRISIILNRLALYLGFTNKQIFKSIPVSEIDLVFRTRIKKDIVKDFLKSVQRYDKHVQKTEAKGKKPQASKRNKQSKELTIFLEMLKNPENEKVEYKETLFAATLQKDRKELGFNMAKDVCAFMNKKGGHLFIGVEDNGTIRGLKDDFEKMPRKKGKDEFTKQMYEVLFSFIDKSFSPLIKDGFFVIGEKDVCILKIESSVKPVYLKNKGVSEFYVRNGSVSEPYDAKQTHDYIELKSIGK